MAGSGIKLPVTKPVSAWNKPLKADFKALFKALSKAAVHGATANWANLATDAADALSAVGFQKNPGQLAWLLLRRAIAQAAFELAEENANLLGGKRLKGPAKLHDSLGSALEQYKFTLDLDFFERPAQLPILELISDSFKKWLIAHGLSEAQADAPSARLPSYFVYSLHKEWAKAPKLYSPVRDAFETPFTKAAKREQDWSLYSAWLKKQVDESMMGENFSLNQVFVPLRAYYEVKKKGAPEDELVETQQGRRKNAQRIVVELEDELTKWLKKRDKKDAIRVISGGPGCGKSSFAKMFAARQTGKSKLKVLFIPLHKLDIEDDLVSAVGGFLKASDLLQYNPLDPERREARLLIIFDGLDELAKQGKVGTEIGLQFVREVDKVVNLQNLKSLKLNVLIAGRELAVQSSATEFRRKGQILYMLPYYITEEERDEYEDTASLLKEDQRHKWWQQYGAVTGKNFGGMPEELEHKGLDEITAQPLLNYLVALSYSRGTVDFSAEINRNAIYDDLLQAVYERGYEDSPHLAIRKIREEDFKRVLEEIALAAWHGDGRAATVNEIHEHCKASGVTRLLEEFKEGAEAGVTSLLTAFYFRQYGERREGDHTFEFTHKSFGEFLAAKRLVRGIRRIEDELKRRRDDLDSGWDERDALKHWVELCGATAMDKDLFHFLEDEISRQKKSTVISWQNMFCSLIAFLLQHRMPMEQLGTSSNFGEQYRSARNAEEGLLATLYACAQRTREISKIVWPESESFGAWIRHLQGQRRGPSNVLSLHCLGRLNLSNCILDAIDLVYADLRGTILRSAWLNVASLFGANLVDADLRGAQMIGANLQWANLSGVNFAKAYLFGSSFREAKLENTNLMGADLRGANFTGAKLKGANFTGAKLKGANFKGANLEGVIGLKK